MPHDDPAERVDEAADTLVWVLGHPLTINEVHATAIGTSGFLIGTIYRTAPAGAQNVAAGVVILLVVYAVFGEPAVKSLPHHADEYNTTVGLETIRCEPWWFLASFTAAFAGAFLVAPLPGA